MHSCKNIERCWISIGLILIASSSQSYVLQNSPMFDKIDTNEFRICMLYLLKQQLPSKFSISTIHSGNSVELSQNNSWWFHHLKENTFIMEYTVYLGSKDVFSGVIEKITHCGNRSKTIRTTWFIQLSSLTFSLLVFLAMEDSYFRN